MAAASLTPRVRILAVCDDATPSSTEERLLAIVVSLDNCRVPTPDEYTFEVWFGANGEESALKGEQPFFVHTSEE
jgi:hypothetical protein